MLAHSATSVCFAPAYLLPCPPVAHPLCRPGAIWWPSCLGLRLHRHLIVTDIPLPTPRMYPAEGYGGWTYAPGHGKDARWLRWCWIEAHRRALYGELPHVRLRHHEVGELQEVQHGLQHRRRGRRRAALAVLDGRGAKRACRGSAVCSFHVQRGRVPIGGAVWNSHSAALPEWRPEQQHGRGAWSTRTCSTVFAAAPNHDRVDAFGRILAC